MNNVLLCQAGKLTPWLLFSPLNFNYSFLSRTNADSSPRSSQFTRILSFKSSESVSGYFFAPFINKFQKLKPLE